MTYKHKNVVSYVYLLSSILRSRNMTAEEKARHISNIAWCIQDGASGYHTDNFKIDNLPTPQRAGTMRNVCSKTS